MTLITSHFTLPIMDPEAALLIKSIGLSPHPEGGYYKETYRSDMEVISPATGTPRPALTDIYFLLVKDEPSRFHRVAHDEIWHFYKGAPLRIIEIDPAVEKHNKIEIGREGTDIFKHCVKAGNWQAAETTGAFSLVGCTVAPGFDYKDFQLMSQRGELTEKALTLLPGIDKYM